MYPGVAIDSLIYGWQSVARTPSPEHRNVSVPRIVG